jgi:hypothetical protein
VQRRGEAAKPLQLLQLIAICSTVAETQGTERQVWGITKEIRWTQERMNAVFWMLRHVALARTDVSEELSASIIRVTRIGELGTLAVTSNRRTLRCTLQWLEALSSSKMSVLTRVTWSNIPEDSILHSHCRENLKPYKKGWFPEIDAAALIFFQKRCKTRSIVLYSSYGMSLFQSPALDWESNPHLLFWPFKL